MTPDVIPLATPGSPPWRASGDALLLVAYGLAAECDLDVLRLRDERRRLRCADLLASLRVHLVDENAQRGARVRSVVRGQVALDLGHLACEALAGPDSRDSASEVGELH